jgi:hypothetical protein
MRPRAEGSDQPGRADALVAVGCSPLGRRRAPAVVCQHPLVVRSAQLGDRRRSPPCGRLGLPQPWHCKARSAARPKAGRGECDRAANADPRDRRGQMRQCDRDAGDRRGTKAIIGRRVASRSSSVTASGPIPAVRRSATWLLFPCLQASGTCLAPASTIRPGSSLRAMRAFRATEGRRFRRSRPKTAVNTRRVLSERRRRFPQVLPRR